MNPDDSNGEIIKYELCYQSGSNVSDCSTSKTATGADNTTVNLTGLEPATNYTVAVKAFTAVGPGPLGDKMTATTNESGEFIPSVC